MPLSTQRLVNLAVALLGNPDMIILDDPFSGLDKGECEHLLSVLNYLHEINHTTLFNLRTGLYAAFPACIQIWRDGRWQVAL